MTRTTVTVKEQPRFMYAFMVVIFVGIIWVASVQFIDMTKKTKTNIRDDSDSPQFAAAAKTKWDYMRDESDE